MGATPLLARGWLAGARGWWWATAAVLGLVLGASIVAAGLLAGMEGATEERVADFFTGDVRVTPAPERTSLREAPDANATGDLVRRLEQAGGPGTVAAPRLETQALLSRRSLIEAYLEEEDEFGVLVPGLAPTDNEFHGAGLLLGLDGAGAERVQAYLVSGRLPRHADGGPVELVMSESAFASYLSQDERASLASWPPEGAALEAFAFEVTAGHVRDGGPVKDVVRLRAKVVGLFDSGLDILDRFAAVGTLEDARRLVGQDPRWGAATAVTVWTDDPAAVRAADPTLGYEDAPGFARAYIGQTLLVVEFLGGILAVALLALPLVLVWHGMQQMLDRQRRQLAVCRAIGVHARTLRLALARLAASLVARALLVAAGLVGLALVVFPLLPDGWAPVPVALGVPLAGTAFTLAVTVLGMGLALVLASRTVLRQDLAATLRE